MGWNANTPLITEDVSGSTSQTRDNWEALENWFDVGHTTFTSAGSGKHTAGKTPILYYGLQTEIDALTSPGTGALAFATDRGILELYRGAWERLTEDSFSRVRNVASSASVPTGTWTVLTTWESTAASGMYDTLDEWASSKFTAKANGYYSVDFMASFTFSSVLFCQRAVGLFKNGVLHTIARRYGRHTVYYPGSDVIKLNAGDYLQLAVWHNYGSSLIVSSANIHIQRIS